MASIICQALGDGADSATATAAGVDGGDGGRRDAEREAAARALRLVDAHHPAAAAAAVDAVLSESARNGATSRGQGLTLVHVTAQLEQPLNTFMS